MEMQKFFLAILRALQCKFVRVRNTRIIPLLEYDSNVADILSGRANCQIKCNALL